jgi:glycosyltransferase involved in cell wall biosynthesis
MPPAIHQFSAGFSRGDAISNEALVLRNILRSWGHPSEIFCDRELVERELRSAVGDVQDYAEACRPEDVVLLHLSTGSRVNEVFAGLPCRKAIMYHNITPPGFFEGLRARTYRSQAEGYEQVKRLADCADVNMAVSRFNADELTGLGYRDVRVMPLVLDLAALRQHTNRGILEAYRDGAVNILFVGRCARNKKLEDCLAAFHYFQRYVEPNSRFIHVGKFGLADPYYSMLLVLTRRLRLENVLFAGGVPQDELNAWYQAADVFLCMSEHEGFGIPVLESMVHDLPVLAYRAAAMPETLDGAGVLFAEKRFDQVAEMMGRLVRDEPFRASVLRGQRARLARYEERDLEAELRSHLAPLLGE